MKRYSSYNDSSVMRYDNNNDSSDDETEQQTKINFFDKFINKFKENLRKVLIILLFMNNLN